MKKWFRPTDKQKNKTACVCSLKKKSVIEKYSQTNPEPNKNFQGKSSWYIRFEYFFFF